MHLHKFADMVLFDEIAIGGTLPETELYREFFKKLHPAQFLNSEIRIPVYEITYSYLTMRENHRVGRKYMFLRLEHDDVEMEIEMALNDWVEDLNREKAYRKIFNVRILEIKPIVYARFYISK